MQKLFENWRWRRQLVALLIVAGSWGIAGSPVEAQQTAPQPVAAVQAQAANINVTPRRVIFEGNKRTEAVYVLNQGNSPVTVDVSLVDNIMLPSGELVPLANVPEKGGEAASVAARLRSANAIVLATPSRLTLLPGKGKTIRLRADIPDPSGGPSELRTHLRVATLPSPSLGLTAEAAASAERGEMVMRIEALFGITIPLIVRSGNVSASLASGDIELTRDNMPAGQDAQTRSVPVLVVPLDRTGTASVYGNLEVRSGSGKAGQLIGLIRGIAVYPEIDRRIARVPLLREVRKGETLSVAFIVDEAKPGATAFRTTYTVP